MYKQTTFSSLPDNASEEKVYKKENESVAVVKLFLLLIFLELNFHIDYSIAEKSLLYYINPILFRSLFVCGFPVRGGIFIKKSLTRPVSTDCELQTKLKVCTESVDIISEEPHEI